MGAAMVLFLLVFVICCIGKPKPVTDDDEEEEEDNRSFCELLVSTLRVMVSKKMWSLLPLIVYSGTSISIWSGMLTPFMEL
jgi:hypothetical protein